MMEILIDISNYSFWILLSILMIWWILIPHKNEYSLRKFLFGDPEHLSPEDYKGSWVGVLIAVIVIPLVLGVFWPILLLATIGWLIVQLVNKILK